MNSIIQTYKTDRGAAKVHAAVRKANDALRVFIQTREKYGLTDVHTIQSKAEWKALSDNIRKLEAKHFV